MNAGDQFDIGPKPAEVWICQLWYPVFRLNTLDDPASYRPQVPTFDTVERRNRDVLPPNLPCYKLSKFGKGKVVLVWAALYRLP